MRELLYVSERSLAPLHEDRPPRWWRRLARSAAAPRWWADRGLEPGQWVHFEHRLSHVVLDFPGPATVFFVSAPAAAAWAGSAAPSGREVGDPSWLLLHGSPEHLVGHRPPRMSDHRHRQSSLAPLYAATGAGEFLRSIGGHRARPAQDELSARVNDVLCGLGHALPGTPAAWMSGYGRVTATVPLCAPQPAPPGRTGRIPEQIVLAEAMFVEYVDGPPFPYARQPST